MTTATRETDRVDEAGPPDGSTVRRLGLSLAIVAVLLGIVASTMPASEVKTGMLSVAAPVLGAVGMDQGWGVFAPDPPAAATLVLARIDRADGSVTTVGPPEDTGLSGYWNYRWRTHIAQLAGAGREPEREAYAAWLATQDRSAGHEPVSVTLLVRYAELAPPGPGPDRGPWQEKAFFATEVAR